MLLATLCLGGISVDARADTEPPTTEQTSKPVESAQPEEIDLQPPGNSQLRIRVARRPWLLEKLTKPKTEPSVKMNPPRPPAEIPDPPSIRRMNPQAPSAGWTRRSAESATPSGKAAGEGNSRDTAINNLRSETPATDPKQEKKTPSGEVKPSESSEKNADEAPALTPVEVEDTKKTTKESPAKKPQKSASAGKSPAGSKPTGNQPASQFIGSDADDEPPIQLDYTGYPMPQMQPNNSVRRMQNSLRQCLRYYYARPEIANERSNWGMLHSIMVYGADTRILAGNKSYSAIAWIAGNNACRGQRLLVEKDGYIEARSGVGLQGHQAQMLAIFALCDVPIDYPVYAGDKRFAIRDVVESEMLACKSGEELTFTLIGLSHYLDTNAVWTNAEGEPWDFERLIREELAQPIVGAACGGTHRLMGYAHALRKRRAEGRPIRGQWKRAEIYTRDYINYAYRLQNRDGSMTTDWFEGREDNGDLDRKVQTTGHIVEWLLTVTPDSHLQDRRLVAAIRFLLTSMYNERDREWKIGPKGHALRSLAMFYERVYRSGTAWSSGSMASTGTSPRR